MPGILNFDLIEVLQGVRDVAHGQCRDHVLGDEPRLAVDLCDADGGVGDAGGSAITLPELATSLFKEPNYRMISISFYCHCRDLTC